MTGAELTAAAGGAFAGGGEMGERMRSCDWSRTLLGPVDAWPQSLKTSVSTCMNSRFAILIWWGKDLVMLYNDAYSMILGTKHPSAFGASGREVWPEIWHIIGPMLEGVMERGEATWSDNLLLELERSGYPEECYFTFSYSPIRDESGGVGGIFTPVQETTNQVIGERRLRTLRDLAEGLRSARAQNREEVCRAASLTLEQNPYDVPFAAFYLFGKEGAAHLAGAAGVSIPNALIPEFVRLDEGVEWPFASAACISNPGSNPEMVTGLEGLPRGAWPLSPHQVLVLPLSPAGQRAGFVLFGINPRKRVDVEYQGFLSLLGNHVSTAIAEMEALQEERKRAEALAELDRAKTQFFSNVSHEFRTPLTLLLGPLEEALSPGLPPQVSEHLRVAHRNALRLQKLVNTLLDFSRIEAGRIQAHYEPTDLGALTAELASTFRSAMEAAGLSFRVDCRPLSRPVHVDREMWEQVVLNLLSNALKYTFEGMVEVRLVERDGRALLSVEDTGTGIPDAELPHVFERFHRVEGTRGRTQEGTGIGLAMLAELVKLHAGTVEARSALGEGSTFTVSLPFGTEHLPVERLVVSRTSTTDPHPMNAYVEEAARWLPSPRRAAGEVRPAISGGKVLVADDNPDMREYIASLLTERYEVETVSNGEEALAAVLDHPPDLILTDIMMPGLDGFGLLQKVRSNPGTSTLPVVLLSARAGEEARVEGLDAGASDYLVKPFTARELMARVGTHMEMARVRKQAAEREAQLRSEAEQARDLAVGVLESIKDGFSSLDRHWHFSYVNPESEKLLGVRREDLIGRSHWDLFPATLGTGLEHEYRRAVRDHVQVDFEYFYEPWGRWFEIRGYPTEEGGLSIYFRDVTEQKRVEGAIQEQEAIRQAEGQRWRQLFLQVPAAVAILRGPNHVFEELNPEYLRVVGRSAEQLLNQPVAEALREIVEQGYVDLLDRVYRTGTPHVAKEALVQIDLRGDGVLQDVYFNFVYSPIRDDADKIDGIFVYAADVTDLVTARRRLEETNQRFTLALEATRGQVYEWDPATGDVTREGGLEDLLGWKESEVPARAEWWRDQVHPEDRNRFLQESESSAPGMRVLSYRVRHRNGSWIWVEDHAVVYRGENGNVRRVIGFTIDVTARNRAEEELRHSHERFEAGLRAVSDLVWTSTASGEIEGEQPSWSQFTGVAYEDYQGYGWAKSVHPEDAQPTIDAWKKCVEQCAPFAFEHRLRRHDGVWRCFSIRAVPVLDDSGAVREWVGVHTDITSRKEAEELLRESEARFRQLAESMPQVVWTATAGGDLDYVNGRWTELTGYDLAASQAGVFRRDMPTEDVEALDRARAEGVRRSEAYAVECRFRASDGALRWHLIRVVPVKNAADEVAKWLGTATDIDEQKRAAEALRLSEWRLRFTLDAASFGSWELNLRTADWRYPGFLDGLLPADRDYVDRCFRKSVEDGTDLNFECRIRRAPDDAIRWIWTFGKSILDGEGKPGQMLGLVSDITARKEGEKALAEANEDLTRANADLEQFAYSASHDLQEPLRSVIVYSELLSKRYSDLLEGQPLEFLGYLMDGAKRMEMLIRDLLAYTQVGHVEDPEAPLDATLSLNAALSNLETAIVESQAEIIAGPMPALPVHSIHLQQLFQNLIGNAIKYRSPATPRIEVAAERQDDGWIFSVRDNGIGIAPQYQERIFGIFKRLHTGDEYSGTGIGLAICKRIEDRYDGRIWVESEPGKGSTFYFTLPA